MTVYRQPSLTNSTIVCIYSKARSATTHSTPTMHTHTHNPPHLHPHTHNIHTHTEKLIAQLFQLAHPRHEAPPSLRHQAFKYLYYLSKVRGSKVIVRWFSHEVSELVPVLELLQQQNTNDVAKWESRYILLLWLSIIIIMPFDLSRMDTPLQPGHTPKQRIVDRMYDIGKLYLSVSDKSRDAATTMLAK